MGTKKFNVGDKVMWERGDVTMTGKVLRDLDQVYDLELELSLEVLTQDGQIVYFTHDGRMFANEPVTLAHV